MVYRLRSHMSRSVILMAIFVITASVVIGGGVRIRSSYGSGSIILTATIAGLGEYANYDTVFATYDGLALGEVDTFCFNKKGNFVPGQSNFNFSLASSDQSPDLSSARGNVKDLMLQFATLEAAESCPNNNFSLLMTTDTNDNGNLSDDTGIVIYSLLELEGTRNGVTEIISQQAFRATCAYVDSDAGGFQATLDCNEVEIAPSELPNMAPFN